MVFKGIEQFILRLQLRYHCIDSIDITGLIPVL